MSLLFYRRAAGRYIVSAPTYDPDAAAWFALVEGATGDNQALEAAVKTALNDFVIGVKADGCFSLLEICGILCGARTATGALIPLIKPIANSNPTQQGTAGGWTYGRKLGLAGNGTNNYVNTNYTIPVGNQNNCHVCIYKSSSANGGTNPYYIGTSNSGLTQLAAIGANAIYPVSGTTTNGITGTPAGLSGFSRTSSTNVIIMRSGSALTTVAIASGTPPTVPLFLNTIDVNGSPGTQWSSAPLTFYSAGKSMTSAQFDSYRSRVNTLMTALAAAIP